ncbi:MAG TPA: hypothetical protein VM198_02515 [Longimicrobiales bacterium]|nr:hypothetical protein [Longimicrobiales bacterium]
MSSPHWSSAMVLAAGLVVFAAAPTPTNAQSISDAIDDVLEWLDEGYELIPEHGQWGLVFGWFAESEEKELRFTATSGESYMIAGGGDANSEDLDICVYDQYDDEIECDVLTDNYPLVSFTAAATGTYRAVLTAYALSGSTSYAGMAVLRER